MQENPAGLQSETSSLDDIPDTAIGKTLLPADEEQWNLEAPAAIVNNSIPQVSDVSQSTADGNPVVGTAVVDITSNEDNQKENSSGFDNITGATLLTGGLAGSHFVKHSTDTPDKDSSTATDGSLQNIEVTSKNPDELEKTILDFNKEQAPTVRITTSDVEESKIDNSEVDTNTNMTTNELSTVEITTPLTENTSQINEQSPKVDTVTDTAQVADEGVSKLMDNVTAAGVTLGATVGLGSNLSKRDSEEVDAATDVVADTVTNMKTDTNVPKNIYPPMPDIWDEVLSEETEIQVNATPDIELSNISEEKLDDVASVVEESGETTDTVIANVTPDTVKIEVISDTMAHEIANEETTDFPSSEVTHDVTGDAIASKVTDEEKTDVAPDPLTNEVTSDANADEVTDEEIADIAPDAIANKVTEEETIDVSSDVVTHDVTSDAIANQVTNEEITDIAPDAIANEVTDEETTDVSSDAVTHEISDEETTQEKAVDENIASVNPIAVAGGVTAGVAGAVIANGIWNNDEVNDKLSDSDVETAIVLSPRTPRWAYTAWKISAADKQQLLQQSDSQLILRLYDVTDIDLSYQTPHLVQQYECEISINHRYVAIPKGDRNYMVEIGYLSNDQRWLSLGSSEITRIFSRPHQDFWFEADAELIIHGATEPGADVTIAGHSIKVKPNGTFHLRIPFTEEVMEYLMTSSAANSKKTKTISMKFTQEKPKF